MVTIETVSAGIDWLTTTATDNLTAKLLLREAEKITREESDRGFFPKPWRQSGYAGVSCGRVQHGERYDSAIVRLSSDLADLEWWRVYQITERATRIDVQVTFRPSITPNAFIKRIHRQLKQHYAGHKTHPKITTWSSSDGGLTVYLGARSSALYFRCYNKEAESGDVEYEGCVRMEIEFKDCAIKPLIGFLFANLPTRDFAGKVVSSFAIEHGISGFPEVHPPPSFYEGQRLVTDEDKSLTWLSTQVQPTVINLIRRGRLADTIKALGLEIMFPDGLHTQHDWTKWSN